MLNLTGGGLSGGYRKYLQRLVPMLHAHAAVQELLVTVPPGHETLPGLGDTVWTWRSGEPWRGFPELRERVRAWRPDVVLIPTARYLNCGAPCVSMVRNMEPMLLPTFRNGVALWARNRLGAEIARRASTSATRVIAVSHFVRDYLVAQWHVDRDRIGTVYHGVDLGARVDEPPVEVQHLAPGRFVFVAGSLLPYRGIEDAIGALARVRAVDMSLAIAGDGSHAYRGRMQALAETLGVSDRVFWLGHLSDPAMAWAYQHCTAFLMTSRVEACPNTALEAMANGAVCITTTSLPMPEFFGEQGLYYAAGDRVRLAAHIDAVAVMPRDARERMRHATRDRAALFSWERTADGTIAELRAALAEPRIIRRNDMRVGALQRIR